VLATRPPGHRPRVGACGVAEEAAPTPPQRVGPAPPPARICAGSAGGWAPVEELREGERGHGAAAMRGERHAWRPWQSARGGDGGVREREGEMAECERKRERKQLDCSTPKNEQRGSSTAFCSSSCSIRWSVNRSSSLCIWGMRQRLQKPLETVLTFRRCRVLSTAK
jgi:hypothetical protein